MTGAAQEQGAGCESVLFLSVLRCCNVYYMWLIFLETSLENCKIHQDEMRWIDILLTHSIINPIHFLSLQSISA